MPDQRRITRAEMLSRIFKNPVYVAIAIAGTLLNYAIFAYFIEISNRGLFLFTVPLYLVYPLLLSGGVLMAISAYSLRIHAIRPVFRASDGILGVLMPAIGSMISSCACSYPLFATLLLAIGVNELAVSDLVSIVGAYQQQLVALIFVLNLALTYYYLGVVARGCSIAKRGAKKR